MNFLKAMFDPAGIFGNWEETPGSQPDTTPSIWNGPEGFMGGMVKGMGSKMQQINQYIDDKNKLVLPDAGKANDAPPAAPFAAQWSYVPGKGPQWLEPVHNGYTETPTRQGDITFNKTVDNGWSSRIDNGPAKGNRI